MKSKIESIALSKNKSNVVVVGVFQGEDIAQVVALLDGDSTDGNRDFFKHAEAVVAQEGFTGKQGQTVTLHTFGSVEPKKILLVGLGKESDYAPSKGRKMAANMARRLMANDKTESVSFLCRTQAVPGVKGKKDKAEKAETKKDSAKNGNESAVTSLDDGMAMERAHLNGSAESFYLQAMMEGWVLGSYTFEKYKSTKDKDKKKGQIDVTFAVAGEGKGEKGSKEFNKSLQTGITIAQATNYARSLIAEPASYMTPTRLGDEAKRISKEHGFSCKVMDAEQVEKLGMGSFLGVARGAEEPLRFIVMNYEAPKSKKTIGIIGKGITFDSGGLSLKTAVGMENMKNDMAGAAVVLAVMDVVGQMQPGVSVMGVIAATENMPGGDALHPGDVLQSMNGKTIEVNNTDAEGRLVLADALTYAARNGADELIDIATLTGAIVTALGKAAAGVFGTDQALIDKLVSSGFRSGEKLWQMPLFSEYKEALKSDIADLKNAGARGEAASSAAGMFLREFIENKPWAHLDIAGPGWLDKVSDENNKGGTAFGVRLLCHYLLSL